MKLSEIEDRDQVINQVRHQVRSQVNKGILNEII
jgi:hypothetical protein